MLIQWIWLCVFLVITSKTNQAPIYLTPPELQEHYGEALEAIFGITVRLQVLLENAPNRNFLVSPLSATLTVGELMLGAEGEFLDQLYELLSVNVHRSNKNSVIHYYGHSNNLTYSLPYSKLHVQLANLVKALETNTKILKQFTLQTTSAFFVDSNLTLNKQFVKNLQLYQSEVRALNFSGDPAGSQHFINSWASEHTNGIIKTVLASPPAPSTAAVLANAVYFLAEWETPFSFELNKNGRFRSSPNVSVDVIYMRGNFENISYVENKKLGCRMIALPYKNRELSMYIILPDENDASEYNISKFAQKLKAADILEMRSKAQNHEVSLQFPKMSLSNSLSILKPLQKYALYKRFQKNQVKQRSSTNDLDALDSLEEKIDEFNRFNVTKEVEISLAGATVDGQLKIGDIFQQMTLSVDEKGTEAAAVTASIIDYMGGSKNFLVDRPFVFFIRHELTSAILFWGTIVDPSQSQ